MGPLWVLNLDLIENVGFIQRPFLPSPVSSSHPHRIQHLVSLCLLSLFSSERLVHQAAKGHTEKVLFFNVTFGIQCLKNKTKQNTVSGGLGAG